MKVVCILSFVSVLLFVAEAAPSKRYYGYNDMSKSDQDRWRDWAKDYVISQGGRPQDINWGPYGKRTLEKKSLSWNDLNNSERNSYRNWVKDYVISQGGRPQDINWGPYGKRTLAERSLGWNDMSYSDRNRWRNWVTNYASGYGVSPQNINWGSYGKRKLSEGEQSQDKQQNIMDGGLEERPSSREDDLSRDESRERPEPFGRNPGGEQGERKEHDRPRISFDLGEERPGQNEIDGKHERPKPDIRLLRMLLELLAKEKEQKRM